MNSITQKILPRHIVDDMIDREIEAAKIEERNSDSDLSDHDLHCDGSNLRCSECYYEFMYEHGDLK